MNEDPIINEVPFLIRPVNYSDSDSWIDSEFINLSKCSHESCIDCGGSGVRHDGMGVCLHALSCSCSKCQPFSY